VIPYVNGIKLARKSNEISINKLNNIEYNAQGPFQKIQNDVMNTYNDTYNAMQCITNKNRSKLGSSLNGSIGPFFGA